MTGLETEHLIDKPSRRRRLYSQLKLLRKYRILVAILVVALVIAISAIIGLLVKIYSGRTISCVPPPNNSTSLDLYRHSASSSDAIFCASVANYIMSVRKGNAVDGAIAGILCSGVINLHSCGIGGGILMIIYIKKENKVYAIDLREMAPGAATETMFVNPSVSSLIGGKSVAVMGTISGFYEIHQRFGKLPWETLLQPTIDILRTGFYVSKNLESSIKYFFNKTNGSAEYNELRQLLINPETGKPKKEGDIITNPKLAKTFETLAKEPYAIKNGSLVQTVVDEINNSSGIVTLDDFKHYETKWRTPVAVQLKDGDNLYALPPPSSGALIAFILNVLSEYSFDSSFLDDCSKTGLFFHRFVETLKFAYGQRSALGDMDFWNVTEVMKNLTSEKFAKWIKSRINDDKTFPVSYYNPQFDIPEDYGTSHFSLISSDGDAISATSTINFKLGSFVMGSNTGILYNDEMDDFSTPNKSNVYHLPPSPSNFIKPYKRPMSSMSPVLIKDKYGNIKLAVGAAGGSRIISSTAQVAALATLLNQSIKQSIDFPRAHHQLLPNSVMVEKNFPENLQKELKKRGHVVEINKDEAVVQGIQRSQNDPKFLECNSDFRKMGLCDGF